MNKQAYLRMMNYGMRSYASPQERQILYKIAMMNKEQGIRKWWNEGGSMKAVWTAIINWFKRLFGMDSETPEKSSDGSSIDAQLERATQAMLNAKTPNQRAKWFYKRQQLLKKKSKGKAQTATNTETASSENKEDLELDQITQAMLNAKTPNQRAKWFAKRQVILKKREQERTQAQAALKDNTAIFSGNPFAVTAAEDPFFNDLNGYIEKKLKEGQPVNTGNGNSFAGLSSMIPFIGKATSYANTKLKQSFEGAQKRITDIKGRYDVLPKDIRFKDAQGYYTGVIDATKKRADRIGITMSATDDPAKRSSLFAQRRELLGQLNKTRQDLANLKQLQKELETVPTQFLDKWEYQRFNKGE